MGRARRAVATAPQNSAVATGPIHTGRAVLPGGGGAYIMAAEARMIFRQLYDSVSGTYTYLLASTRGGEALIIDPVLEKVER